ncbi:TonB-dependent receptor domain-containing protein [Methylocystis sp.]|uniref:TonB-dependent receptor family protein n=1 Tax=Methylocystis sp. TaxID=1911079 RepID=UPI002733EF68|nr:TonB-dependent receptor [Methylocystis sp.]MDP3553852.1 TonB-dependent receptor [Methylocystis sp.]
MSSRSKLMHGVALGALALLSSAPVVHAQQSLPTIDIGGQRRAGPVRIAPRGPAVATPAVSEASTGDPGYAPGFNPIRAKLPIYRDPPGQTVTTVNTKFLSPTPLADVRRVLEYSPGVSIQQGNNPRDLFISIRGSGNRLGVGFPTGVRNIMLYEDGFPITTADGNGRTDLLDPHSYAAVDVYRGPSSALFGNYAYAGAINFRTFSGAEIDGVHTGSEFGSFGYVNNYVRVGKAVKDSVLGGFDLSFFASDANSTGYTRNSFSGKQAKLLGRWDVTPTDRVIVKYIANNLRSEFINRENINVFYLNPFQQNYGCSIAVPLNLNLCNNLFVPANGISGATVRQSVWQLGTHTNSLRQIGGVQFEHDFDNATTWRSQFTYDYLDTINGAWPPPIIGPGGQGGPVGLRGPTVSITGQSDITSHTDLFGFPATHFLQFFYSNAKTTNPLFNQIANTWYSGAIGAQVGKLDYYTSNIGLRAREEIALAPGLTGVVGFSANWNRVWGVNTAYNYPANLAPRFPTQVAVDNDYWNTAPEASLTYRYSPEWQVRARYATGYSTPTFVFLTTTRNGVGQNPLKAQTNMGVDLGIDWTPRPDLTVSVTGFNEWHRNEILTLSNGLISYSQNIPSTLHRGVELNADWRPFDGWRLIAAYTFNNQFVTNFWEDLGNVAGRAALYNRAGNRIPNVPPHTVTMRLGYDQPYGDLSGLGAYAEYIFKSDYTIDNANFTTLPSYSVFNLNAHYNRDIDNFYFKNIELYFEASNIFNRTYVAGAFVVANSLLAGTPIQTPLVWPTGGLVTAQGAGIIAGQPRAFTGGIKLRF